MKYIVFGGEGFLGSHLINALKKHDFSYQSCDLLVEEETPNKKKVDIRLPDSVKSVPIQEDDIIINLAANQYHLPVPSKGTKEFFFETNAQGTENILKHAYVNGCRNAIFFTTDMVYGKPQSLPVKEDHPQKPFGYYGQSKKESERIINSWRDKGMNITVFRPRMIIGPGRLGILKKLFKFIDLNLPVPLIGSGQNHYQMISVFDCVSAIEKAIANGFPNRNYNLGSENPPNTKTLLQNLIKYANSKSIVVPIKASLIKPVPSLFEKIGIPVMYKEQYMIADEEYILDISRTKEELGWHPEYNDTDMLKEAYNEYKQIKK